MAQDQIIYPGGIPGPYENPCVMLRIMMYVKGVGLPQYPNLTEFKFEPHPFHPKNISPEVFTVTRKFLEEEIERLTKVMGML